VEGPLKISSTNCGNRFPIGITVYFAFAFLVSRLIEATGQRSIIQVLESFSDLHRSATGPAGGRNAVPQ
jgi:hypothetical protein